MTPRGTGMIYAMGRVLNYALAPRHLLVLSLMGSASLARADALDDYIREQMRKRDVPGLSLAVVDGGKIVETRCYGVLEKGTGRKVTPSTLFQAGSISKSVAAVGALRLVEKGVLSLDDDINDKLRSWKVPASPFAKDQKVTLRRILSHTAGMTVHGFPGYATDVPTPTLVQVLNGAAPANTPAIVVDQVPGTEWRYSGGGYTVMQQMMLDVTGESFPEYMRTNVLVPAGMTDSSYEQPQPAERATRTAAGTEQDGSVVKGRWHLYPEMAAAGLWTTPTDLARFIIAIQRSFAGNPGSVLKSTTAAEMLTDQKSGDGLGVFLQGSGNGARFTHSGRDEGFDALFVGSVRTGQGVAVMVNANVDAPLLDRIVQEMAAKYRWPEYPSPPAKPTVVAVPQSEIRARAGNYSSGGQTLTLIEAKGRLEAHSGLPYLDDVLPIGKEEFVLPEFGRKAAFDKDAFVLRGGGGQPESRFTKITGALNDLKVRTDPIGARAESVRQFFEAAPAGGNAIANASYLTPGAQKDFRAGLGELAKFDAMGFLGEVDVTDRGVSRHGSKVVRITEYRVRSHGKILYAIVFFAEGGLITDFDVVPG